MRETGFTVYDGGPVRYDPVEWDINNGRCDEWAGLAARRLGVGSCTMWMDPYHCVLFYKGRWYDADCLDGEVDWANLPMFKDPGLDRPEPLPKEENVSASDMPPDVVASLDQLMAEADDKYAQLVAMLNELTEEHGIYNAMAIIGTSLDKAPQATLVSMVLTGMRREMISREDTKLEEP